MEKGGLTNREGAIQGLNGGGRHLERENIVLGLILILLLIWLSLAVVLGAGSLWLQGYFYSEPTPGLVWRAPAVATVLTAFLALWAFLAYRGLGNFDPLFFTAATDKEYAYFYSVEKGKDRVRFEQVKGGGTFSGTKYVDRKRSPPRPWSRYDSENRLVEAIIVEDAPGKEVQFNLVRPAGGSFKQEELARYVEEKGRRVMTEDRMGRIESSGCGQVLIHLLLNLVHVGLWFVCLWLLLRFQWPHALGLAVAVAVVVALLVVPQVLERAVQAAPPKALLASGRSAGLIVSPRQARSSHQPEA